MDALTDGAWLDNIINMVTAYGLEVIGAILLLIGAKIASGWARKATKKGLERSKMDVTLIKFFSNMMGWLVLAIGVIAALELFGIQTTSFVAILGAAGLAVGLALQGTLSHLASGIMLLIFRPFKVGDVVTVAGQTGQVFEIDLFATKLDTPDNRRIIIPNGEIAGSTIVNLTFHESVRVEVNVGTDYGADLDHVRNVLLAAAEALPGRKQETPVAVALLELGGSSIDWQVRVWTKTGDYNEYLDLRDALTRATKMALDKADIGIPFPQMDVHLDGVLNKN